METWVVCCQGTTQVVVAGAAVAQHAKQTCMSGNYRVILAIYGLACDPSVVADFRENIKAIAHECFGWSVFAVPDKGLEVRAGEEPLVPIWDFELCSPADVSVVFSVRSHTKQDHGFLSLFLNASHVCYGDGVGLYTDSRYLAPTVQESRFRMMTPLRACAGKVKRALWPSSRGPLGYSCGYFTIAEAGGSIPEFPSMLTDVPLLLNAFGKVGATFSRSSNLEDWLRGKEAVCLLMTSTQSEWGRIQQSQEVQLYLDQVQKIGASYVLLKTHPRERRDKIDNLRSAIEKAGHRLAEVSELLQDECLPVESLFMRALGAANVHCATSSSACYGLALLGGICPVIGFGKQAVVKHFASHYVEERLRHEQLLNAFTPRFQKLHEEWSPRHN